MNKLDTQYQTLLQTILDFGVEKKDRTGTGTKSIFGYTIRHNMKDGFPLLTTKKMAWKTMVTELLWFLRGDTNIKFLVDNDCHIWDGDAYKRYSLIAGMSTQVQTLTKEEFINKIKTDDEFAKKWGELGPIYGKQWRNWNGEYSLTKGWEYKPGIDQIANLINDLKTNPDSRRLMVNSWNVAELDSMVLPPCHYGFQVYTRELSLEERTKLLKDRSDFKRDFYDRNGKLIIEEKSVLDESNIPTRAISLMWNQRSVDTFLGLPFNIASYGLLLEIIAKAVNMVPDELIGNLGDVHLYNNHVEQAKEQIGKLSWEERKEFLTEEQFKEFGNISPFTDKMIHWWLDCLNVPYSKRMPYPLPKLFINNEFWNHDYQTIDGWINSMEIGDFQIENYQSHPTIKAPLSN